MLHFSPLVAYTLIVRQRIHMKTLSTLLAVFVLPLSLEAHQDTVITLKGKSLENLPKQFQPASFDTKEASLTIAAKKLVFPDALTSILEAPESYDLRIVSSWYHDPEILPPYISIKITPKGRHFTYSIMVDMNGPKILQVELELNESDKVTRWVPVDPAYWAKTNGKETTTTRTKKEVEQDGADQPATVPKLKSEGKEKPKPDAEVRPR